MSSAPNIDSLEASLNSFSADERSHALNRLVGLTQQEILATTPVKQAANMHCHTFYSFNAYGYSPSGLAWMAKKNGYPLLGIVDFDVLDAVDEFLDACLTAGVRGSAALETRVFIPEFATREINSPGEPGVYYYMGIGFTSSSAPEEGAEILADMRLRAKQRNIAMMERLNAYLDSVRLDYQRDVLPLTPAGNATERHMLEAYTKTASTLSDPVGFWAEKLKLPLEQVAAQIKNMPVFQNTIRSKLMKRGGVGYAQPDKGTFPTLDQVTRMITACQALPCAAWVDGTSAGEQAMPELLDLLINRGVAALNIVPDRNWNISDPQVKQIKVNNLYQVVDLARQLDLPLNIGTEMNTYGQKLMDDFDTPELAPVRKAFLDGAYFIYGHTMVQRASGLGYQSQWAQNFLPTRRAKNEFYTRLGKLIPPGHASLTRLKEIPGDASPEDYLRRLEVN